MKRGQATLLAAVMLVSVVSGSCFFLSPTLEKKDNLNKQAELLDSIEAGGGAVIVDDAVKSMVIDFYDEPEIEPVIEPMSGEKPQAEVLTATQTRESEADDVTKITGIGVLSIDKIGLKLPVVDGVSNEQLKIAVGRVPETAVIGEIGNAVIAGHRSYTYGDYFNRLGEMEIGDIIRYTPKGGEAMAFEVFEIIEIEPGDQSAFTQPEDQAIITLYTCTPIRTATHRLLVRASLSY